MKAIAKLVLLVLLLTLNACVDTNSEKITIGFSQCVSNDLWRQEMNKSMQIQADLFDNVNLEILDANSNVNLQAEQIQQFIDKNVDAIIVSPWQSAPVTPVIQKAIDNGIPVLVVDRKTDNQTYTAYLGADNFVVGENVGKYMASLGSQNFNIVEIKGLKGSSPAYKRSLGFQNEIKKYSNLHLVDSINANWEKQSVKEDFKKLLSKRNNIDIVFAPNDMMAYGAWEVARELEVEKNIKFIGVVGLPGPNVGLDLVKKKGFLTTTILYPTGGDEALRLALSLVTNQKIAKNNILESTVIDHRNAFILESQFNRINQKVNDINTLQTNINQL